MSINIKYIKIYKNVLAKVCTVAVVQHIFGVNIFFWKYLLTLYIYTIIYLFVLPAWNIM